MRLEKQCVHCKKTFYKRPRTELSRWFGNDKKPGGIKYCSFNCYKAALAYTPHNCTTHNKTNTRLYHVWDNMRRRCSYPAHPSFKDYGARGIGVCNEWQNSFERFYEWAKAFEFEKGYSLERKDNAKGYSPENCCWATRREQQNNRRTNVYIEAFGERKSLKEWSRDERCKTTLKGLTHRIKTKWPAELAIALPKNTKLKSFLQHYHHPSKLL